MRLSLFLIPVLLSSAACSDPATFADDAGVEAETSARATAAASSQTPAGKARSVAESTDAYEFKYSYPAQAGVYPALREHLDAELDETKAGLAKDAEAWKAETEREGFPFNPYSAASEWKVVAAIPGWLSLSNEFSTYTGGAHGMYGMDTLLFDKRAEAIRRPLDLFASPEALWSAVEGRWCTALDTAREKRRGAPVDKSDETFGGCPGIEELTVLIGSSNGKTFDRMTLYAGPYVAGPYAEGAYEIDLDIDAAVLKAVKTEYRGAFSIKR